MTVERLRAAATWRPIPNCPGRFVMASVAADLAPRDLVGPEIQLEEFRVPTARDVVVVGRFADGGLISYKRANGTYVHTLNTVDGFQRKLAQLGITLAGTA
jgi:phage baseplate assembly protein gpV